MKIKSKLRINFNEIYHHLCFLSFLDPPEIEQEETFIHTGEGDETEVICIVHASPKAKVTWLKDGFPVDESRNPVNQRGNRHTLVIPNVNEESFGDYTCEAQNSFGTQSKSTRVSGTIIFIFRHFKDCCRTVSNTSTFLSDNL